MATPNYSQASDGLRRTEFFDGSISPVLPGSYECSTGSGYIFKRTWNGTDWISPVNGAPTSVRMPWRGIEPESVEIGAYPSNLREALRADRELRIAATTTLPNPTDTIIAPSSVIH